MIVPKNGAGSYSLAKLHRDFQISLWLSSNVVSEHQN